MISEPVFVYNLETDNLNESGIILTTMISYYETMVLKV